MIRQGSADVFARECCDGCIDNVLASLQELRSTLVEKHVKLPDMRDGPLYLLIDAMALGIRQFLTYEELLKRSDDAPPHSGFKGFHRPTDVR